MCRASFRVTAALMGGWMGCATGGRSYPQPAHARPLGLTLSPATADIGCLSSGVIVIGILRIANPTPEARCGAVLWDWDDGSTSGRKNGSCVEEEMEGWGEDAQLVISSGAGGQHIYRARGTYRVSVKVGKRIHETAALRVRGCGFSEED